MKLQFKGQTYEAARNKVKTVGTESVACYRGQKYQIRVPLLSHNSQKSHLVACVRKYRGVSYIVEQQTFLPPEAREYAISK